MDRKRWEQTEEGIALLDEQGTRIALIAAEDGAEDTLSADGEALCLVRRTKVPVTHMCVEVRTLFPAVHVTVPAVSYDGNPWGHDHEYKGYGKDGDPYVYAAHRTILPGAGISTGENTGFALYGEPCSPTPGAAPSGSSFLREGTAVHRLIWPEEEGPQVLYADGWGEAIRGHMEPQTEFRAKLFVGRHADRRMMAYAWQKAWEEKEPASCRTPEEIWQLSADYARRLYTEEPDGFKAFSIGFTWKNGEWVKRPDFKYEIGWCGQNASLAISLMEDYCRSGNEESLRMGFAVLDTWLAMARSRDGLLLTRYDPEDSLIDACNLGTAGCQFLEAYALVGELGIKRESYLDAAIEVAEFALARQRDNGQIGMSWNRDGSLHTLEGTAGGFLVLPLVKLAEFLRRGENAADAPAQAVVRKRSSAHTWQEYLAAAEKAYAFYYAEFARNSYGTSGALDTCCIDKESAIPLLKGAVYLYGMTENPGYIHKAEDAAWYLSTWQWHQHTVYPSGTVLGALGYDTFGGTAVSTSHHHLDPFALCYIPELVRLSEITGNAQWAERAQGIWANASQLISDGSLRIGNTAPRPAGSCDEGILHTRWGTRREGGWGAPFSTTQWLVAWPCAFRLEVLRKKAPVR